jgi:hypothetical protein
MQIIFNVEHFNNSFKNTQTREVKSTTEITQTPGSNTQTPGGKKKPAPGMAPVILLHMRNRVSGLTGTETLQ